MRPIDADELIKYIEKGLRENPHGDGRIRSNHTSEYMHFLGMVNRMPTVPLAVDESRKMDSDPATAKKRIIDVACGSRMFWFDKSNPDVEFCDCRQVERREYYPGRFIEILPDTVCDFTSLPFLDGTYKLVVFDPPHLKRAGEKSWTMMKYGVLKGDWKEMLRKGFEECFRILDDDGVLIFKWSEVQIPLREIIPLSPYPPLFGNRGGKNNSTHWLCFMKPQGRKGT